MLGLKITVFLLLPFVYLSQINKYDVCANAIEIELDKKYALHFLGEKKIDASRFFGYLENYTPTKNAIFLFFNPSSFGEVQLYCSTNETKIDVLILKTSVEDNCNEIHSQKASAIFIKTQINCSEFNGQSFSVEPGYSYSIIFIGGERVESKINFELKFIANSSLDKINYNRFLLNFVFLPDKPIYEIHVLDEKTKYPVPARIIFNTKSDMDGTYLTSDLYLNIPRAIKGATISVDAKGYLSKDIKNYTIPYQKKVVDSIFLSRFIRGETNKLEDIFFEEGTAVILEESNIKLKRLKDFLILNYEIEIEIQGHVNSTGTEKKGQLQILSKKRAKEILKYLVSMGIDKKRLSAIGFGNKKPIFENPKNEAQKEANRRVEILIK